MLCCAMFMRACYATGMIYAKKSRDTLNYSNNLVQSCYPHWQCPTSGQTLIDRLEDYKREETAALRRERQMHIDVMALQLETLARLEGLRHPLQPAIQITRDDHIPRNNVSADAGAGQVTSLNINTDGSRAPTDAHDTPLHGTPTRLRDPLASPPTNMAPPLFAATTQASPVIPPDQSHPRLQAPPDLVRNSLQIPRTIGLSSDFCQILNMSTLDGDLSMVGSREASETRNDDRRTEQDYLWLQRYHDHLAQRHEDSLTLASASENGQRDE
jgi:hypothetical protein